MTRPATTGLRLGLRANAAQFTLLVTVNALVGGLLGSERTVLPLLAERDFHLAAYTAALTYILAFGATKAVTNFFAGTLSDRYGRKPVLLAGWLVGLPIPLLIIWAPSWGWIVAANVLLGVNQGLAWSTTVIMKIDLAGPHRRGLAMGLNEAAGYLAVAGTAAATGALAADHGLRPAPFLLALAYAALGLGLSTFFVKETRGHAHHEATTAAAGAHGAELPTRRVAALVSYREPALSSAAQAGLVNNLNDGLAWGLFPLLFATAGLTLNQIGTLAALYPAVWGLGQLATGPLSDRYGRKRLIVTGMLLQAAALAWTAAVASFTAWALAAVLLGINQGLAWSTTVIMKIDLAGPHRRGLAMGLNEAAGYLAVAGTAAATGALAAQYGLRPAPFLLALAYAALGLGLATFFVKETRGHAHHEATTATNGAHGADLPTRQVAALVSYREPALSSAAQAGMVNNLNDGLAWGLFPLLFATTGLSLGQIGTLAALYPAVWGLGQLATGPLSDRYGRKPFIVAGMLLQAAALAWIAAADTFTAWALAAILLGAGTALVYPTLLAAIGDVAHPAWRARAVGVYRLWRDGGFAIGALLAGILADAYGIRTATTAVAALTAASGILAAVRMYETHQRRTARPSTV